MSRTTYCQGCARFFGMDTCEAFPDGDGIPLEILTGEQLHDKPIEGDHGLQYVSLDRAED